MSPLKLSPGSSKPLKPSQPVELANLVPMLGSWSGSGTVQMTPEGPLSPWTAQTDMKKALGGFFIQQDTLVDLGNLVPANIASRAMYGFDQATNRYMVLSANSVIGVRSSEFTWAGQNTMIRVVASVENGCSVVDRWITELSSTGYEFICNRAIGSDPNFVHVRGTMARTETTLPEPPFEAGVFPPPSNEMKKLSKIVGFYTIESKYTSKPGAPPLEASGTEDTVPLFGGIVLQSQLKSDPVLGVPGFEAWGAKGWDAGIQSYITVQADNFGAVEASVMRWVGDDLVWTDEMLRMGEPGVMRGIIQVTDANGVESVESDSIVGTGAPWREFEGTYTRTGKGT